MKNLDLERMKQTQEVSVDNGMLFLVMSMVSSKTENQQSSSYL